MNTRFRRLWIAVRPAALWLIDASGRLAGRALALLNPLARRLRRNRYRPGSVLHISVMVHTAHQAASLLRAQGIDAKYLAIGSSPIWRDCDYQFNTTRWPALNRWREFWLFWRLISQFEIVHSHFMMFPSASLWEADELKKMGRKLIVHFRGCEAREREKNMRLHPKVNICQECDHASPLCRQEQSVNRRAVADRAADVILVTTPDMRDFYPKAEHLPFYTPTPDSPLFQPAAGPPARAGRPFKIVHVTVHPGIEGTRHIRMAVDRLNAQGYRIEFVHLSWVDQETIRRQLEDADLAIGKMKMGYFANFQIESMMAGVPTITYVRDEFMTPQLRESAFIFATLDNLEAVIRRCIDHPEELRKKRENARASILKLHDNAAVTGRLIDIYGTLSPHFRRAA